MTVSIGSNPSSIPPTSGRQKISFASVSLSGIKDPIDYYTKNVKSGISDNPIQPDGTKLDTKG